MRALVIHVISVPLLILISTSGATPAEEHPIMSAQHPSLLCTRDDLAEIRSRLEREPYKNWWTNAVRLADANYEVDKEVEFQQLEYARRARHAAFNYLVSSNERYAGKALGWMKALPRLEPSDMSGKTHLRLAQTGRDFAEAYDILLPWMAAEHPDDRAAIAAELHYVGWELREFGPIWYGVHKNNHGIRQFSGLGLVALALRDDPDYSGDASDWLEYATEHCLVHLRHQICDPQEGGFAEGMNYFNYSGEIMWDFFYALRNVTGRDLWAEPDIRNLHIYAARAQMPTGCWPMYDDSAYGYFPCQIFCDAYPDDAGLFADRFASRQAALEAGYGEFTTSGRKLNPADDYLLSIIHYDDAIEPVPPEYPTLEVLEKAGDAVFRIGDGPESIYLNMRIEGVRAAFNAAAHDHADPLSFFLQAYGENLLLDPGYINWEERQRVATADNHNMLTVDGKGPANPVAGTPVEGFVELTDYGLDPNPHVSARTTYQGATFGRRIELVDDKYFIIRDVAESDRSRLFTYNLHGHAGAGAGGDFSLSGKTVTWERERGGVVCHVIYTGPNAEYIIDEDEHSFASGDWTTHSVLRVNSNWTMVGFITIVVPYKKPGPRPHFSGDYLDGLKLFIDGDVYDIPLY